ncbi:chlorophyllase, Alpha/Beta hydrolase fold protein [Artemisia annua]|uniref:Chlorophyllase, Alpha/Beta hydrolase fold protein n=1 Tax=Artemisia annua TaxID=35608 RepID=A0A2U1KLY8_ARTAN|nr:chlorophyllase, Alpha/Beta hydrolase fold protein [Artemisia annua]
MELYTESLIAPASTTCFENGSYTVKSTRVRKSSGSTPNPPLYIVYPTERGTYPVILFLHGFSIPNTSYSDLFEFIASHGYIIVAPGQTLFGFVTGLCICSAVSDVEDAAETANWIHKDDGQNLQLVLPHDVSPDTDNVALAGHSKGGKVAFALALGHAHTHLKFKALIGLDPVEGSNTSNRIEPKILNYIPQDFNLAMPVALIGTGLGDDSCCGCVPPVAPWGCNHPFFFDECKPPSCYFVARDFGHLDMVDDWLVRLAGMFICKTGKGSKDDMRRACGGIFVAFLKAYMFHNADDLTAIIDSPNSVAPVKLDPVLWLQS